MFQRRRLRTRVKELELIQNRHSIYLEGRFNKPQETVVRHEPLPLPVGGELVYTHAPTGERITVAVNVNRVTGEISIIGYTPLPMSWRASDIRVDLSLYWPTS